MIGRQVIMVNKPIQRGYLRIQTGKLIYTALRYFDWYWGRKEFADKTAKEYLPFVEFSHSTPLIRRLKNVDMWLQYNKITNLKIASKKVNGVTIKPGQTFSFWRLVGKPSKRKGYKEGLVLNNGKLSSGVGGGLCQLTNLIYWMAIHTPLTVVERYRHSYDVFPDSDRTQPFGSGATCVYNYRDLQLYNGTDRDFQLIVWLTEDNLTGEFRTNILSDERYEVYEKNHHIYHTFWGAYIRCNELHRRVVTTKGQILDDEFITRNEAVMMYQPFLEAGINDTK